MNLNIKFNGIPMPCVYSLMITRTLWTYSKINIQFNAMIPNMKFEVYIYYV